MKINNITKNFTNKNEVKYVLKNVSCEFSLGKTYVLLGRNAVGKSTLLKTIARRINPDKGSVEYGDLLKDDTLSIACHFDPLEMANYMSVNYNGLTLFKLYNEYLPNFNFDYAKDLANKFNINLKSKVRNLSAASKATLTVITTLASNQKILIFDEPVQLLSSDLRDLFYKELLSVCMNDEKIVIVSTHIINEIQNIASNVLIIKDSELVVDEEIDVLKEKYDNISLEEIFMKVVGEEDETIN